MVTNSARFSVPRFILRSATIIIFNLLLPLSALAADFTARHLGDYGNVTVMETSGNYDEKLPDGTSNAAARQAIAREFFKSHRDEYDFLVIFTNFSFKMTTDAVAFHLGVRNDVQGIGKQIFDNSHLYGSSGRLQGTIDMGSMDGIWTDPLDKHFDFTLGTLAHEMLHQWGSFVRFRDWNGATSSGLLGKDGSHWSYLLDTKGSLEYGNQWQDNGNGIFTAVAARSYYSPLDLYLMGMIDKSKVPPMLLIDNPAIDPARMPEVGATISGAPRTVTIDDIIAVEGERVPSAGNAQKQFKMGFVYAVTPGTFSPEDIQGIETVRNGFLTRFSVLTDGRGLVEVAVAPKENLPTNPGVLPPTTVPRILPPNIDDGVAWLAAHQLGDGSWTDFALTAERDTAEAVTTLQLFPSSQSQFRSGLQWLGSSAPANSDFLARRLVATLQAGGDGASLQSELLSRRNPDGGWGSGRNFVSNPTDTALALKALVRAGYGDQQVIGSAVALLQASQQGDGGWSGEDAVSAIQPTAAVLAAFNNCRRSFPLDNAISRAIGFLAGKQNPDGGFGNSPSTVYDSAQAIMALQEAGSGREVTSRGVAYLLGLQSGNGSWYDSPYQTALAVRAVWQTNVEPDLAVSVDDISFIPEKITTLPTSAVVSAVVRNLGRSDVSQATVALYDGEVVPGKKVAEQTLAFPGMASTTVTFPLPVSDGKEHLLYLVVDPDSRLEESNRSNNSAAKRLLPETTFDFSVAAGDLTAAPGQLELLQEMKITATVANQGTVDASNLPLRFFIDEPGAPFDIATVVVAIPAGGRVSKEFTWKATKPGTNLPLTVQIDPADAFNELSEANNRAVTLVSVNNVTVTDPNLTLAGKDIVVTPQPVNERGSVTVTATLRNDGYSTATAVKVNFYQGVPGRDGILLGSRTIASLAPGESAAVAVDWGPIPAAGETVIYVMLDPDNTVKEVTENDNDAFAVLTVRGLPDLAVTAASVALTPSAPRDGESVACGVTVQNRGDQDATAVMVQLREGATVIGTQVIPVIRGKSQWTAEFAHVFASGVHQLTAVVDPDGSLVEQTRENNTAVKTFGVHNGSLWLSEAYISPNGDGVKDSTRFFFRLAAETAAKVVVVNREGATVRTFSGGELSATTGSTITWDGLNDGGMVVADGEYRLQVRDQSDAILGSLPVSVDNNRSPLAEAIGTKYLQRNDIGCNATFAATDWSWLADESGFVVSSLKGYGAENKVVYASSEGEVLKTIVRNYFSSYDVLSPQPNGTKTTFVEKLNSSNNLLIYDKDKDSPGLLWLDSGRRTGEAVEQKWAADGSALAVMLPSYNIWRTATDYLYLIGDSGNGFLTRIPTNGSGLLFEWSPDSSRLAYTDNRTRVYLRAQGAADSQLLYTSPYADLDSLDWLDNNRLLVSRYNDGTFVFDIATGTATKISAENYPILAPDRKKMLFVNDSGAVLVATDGTVLGTFTAANYSLAEYLEWSPDSRYAAVYVPDTVHALLVIDTAANRTVEVARGENLFSLWADEHTLIYAVPSGYSADPGALMVHDLLAEKSALLQSFTTGSARVAMDVSLSPLGNYLSWTDPYNRACPNPSYIVASSLLNLSGTLTAVSGSGSVTLRGTAMDANFGGWRLEYADTANPDSWRLVAPPSDVAMLDDVFVTWVPPGAGSFSVRLTVWDKAGNQVTSRQSVSWGVQSAVTNIYQSLQAFSPNGDGVKDTVEVYYRQAAPAHLDFAVYNDKAAIIKTGYAAAGSDHLSWDGRDEAGSLVSDGKYRIKLSDYELAVTVDNTFPDVAGNFGRINPYYYDEYSQFTFADLSGHIFDADLKSWLVEYGNGENPQAWHEYYTGSSIVVAKDAAGAPILAPPGDDRIIRFSPDDIRFLAGKTLRIVAEDYAGNRSSLPVGMVEERLVLQKVDGGSPTQMTLPQLQEFYANSPPALKFITETVMHGGDAKGFFLYTKLKPAQHKLQAMTTIRTPLLSSRLQYYKGGWHDSAAAMTFAAGSSLFDFDNAAIDGIFAIRIKTTDITGKEYLSNTFLIGGDGAPGDSTPAPLPTEDDTTSGSGAGVFAAAFEAVHVEADGCNLVSGRIELPAGKLLVQGAQSLTFGLQTGAGLIPLGHAVTTSKSPGTIMVDTPNIIEGVYPLQAVFTMANNTTREVLASNKVFVDRTPPQAALIAPAANQKACTVKMTDAQGSWTGIDVGGVIADNIKVKRYELYYGLGENPSAWFPAMTGSGNQARAIVGREPVNGRIGTWNVNNLDLSRLVVKLRVVDEAGNVSCDIKPFAVDTTLPFTTLSAEPQLFSPNGDGNADEAKAIFQVDENVTLDVRVHGLINGAELTPLPSRTVVTGRQHPAGSGAVTWEGKGDGGATLQDGRYGVAVTAVDACGNTALKWTPVEVDTTPPLVVVSYPTTLSSLPGNIVEVKGTAADTHFRSYLLEAGTGDIPVAWTRISTGATPVNSGLLGLWNISGLQGRWTLRLAAEDLAGNKGVTTVTLDIGQRDSLVKSLSATPAAFSPNSDQKLDAVRIDYEVADACQSKLDILNATGHVVWSQPVTAVGAGAHSFSWDGKTGEGITCSDGQYSVRLTANLAADPLMSRAESITLVLDSAAPAMTIREPAENAFLSRSDVAVVGTVGDATLTEYTLKIFGPAGTAAIDSGSLNRTDYTFGLLKDLAEGAYTITAEAKDRGENQTKLTRLFTIDRTPPKVSLDTPKPGDFFGDSQKIVNVTGTIVESNLARYSLRYGVGAAPTVWQEIAGGDQLPAAPQLAVLKVGAGDGIADGLYTISLKAIDKAGLESESRVRLIVDNSSPTVTITSPKQGAYVTGTMAVKGTVVDANLDKGLLEISQAGCGEAFKWAPLATLPVNVTDGLLESLTTLPGDGEYCLRLSATDRTGNKAEAKISVVIDTRPPAAPQLAGMVESKAAALLTWVGHGEADLAGYNLYRNGLRLNPALLIDGEYRSAALSEGEHIYTVRAVDRAGNESEPSSPVKVRIDLTPPNTQILAPADGATVRSLVDIKGIASSRDDFKEYRISVGQGSSPASWTLLRRSPVPIPSGLLSQWETVGLPDGTPFAIKLEGEDTSGNIATRVVSVTIDNIPPQAPLLLSAMAGGNDVSLRWAANTETDLAGYLLYRNGQLVNARGGAGGNPLTQVVTGTDYLDRSVPDGNLAYHLVAVDKAGNMSTSSSSLQVMVDTRPPHAVIVSPADDTEFEQGIWVKADSPDSDISEVLFQYKKSVDSAWSNLGTAVARAPFTVYFDPGSMGLGYADYEIRALATDAGAKTDPLPTPVTVIYTDLTPPAVPWSLKALEKGSGVALSWEPATDPDIKGYNVYELLADGRVMHKGGMVKEPVYLVTNLADGVHVFAVSAVDLYGNESSRSASISTRVYGPTLMQPYTPTGSSSVSLHGGGADAGTRVEVWSETRSGVAAIASTVADGQGDFTVDISGLQLGENRIIVRAIDAHGNVSRDSYPVVVTYNDVPAAPTGLNGSEQSFDVALNWNPSPEADLAGYNLYRNGKKLNRSVQASSGAVSASSLEPGSLPAHALDRNAATSWRSAPGNGMFTPQWLEVGLPTATLISQIDLHWGAKNDAAGGEILHAGKALEVQAWSGQAWIPLVSISDNAARNNSFPLSPSYRTDRIRIYVTETTDQSSAKQVRIDEIGIMLDELIGLQPSFADLQLHDGVYSYTVTAVDTVGFESAASEAVTMIVGDVVPPAAPAGLAAAVNRTDVSLDWSLTANAEPDLAGYNIYRSASAGWMKVNAVVLTGKSYLDSGLRNGSYSYRITAVDTAGNESLPSNEVNAVVAEVLPQPPKNVTITPLSEGRKLQIAWEVAGGSVACNLYRSATAGGPYERVNAVPLTALPYLDAGLANGTSYYYVLTSLDAFGNEGSYSAEASGIPADTILPTRPLLYAPTVAALPVTIAANETTVSGMVESATAVELFRNGYSQGMSEPLGNDLFRTHTLPYSAYSSSISVDGTQLAYVDANNFNIWIRNLSSGATSQVPQAGGRRVQWSPDGKKLAYTFLLNYASRIAIYNVDTGMSTLLTQDTNVSEDLPAWAPDGSAIIFTSTRGGYQDLWIKELDSGNLVRITTGKYAYAPRFSPDGKKISYFLGMRLHVHDLVANVSELVDNSVSYYLSDWSPDGSKLIFESWRNGNSSVYVYDLKSHAQSQVTSVPGPKLALAWSPGGNDIAFLRSETNGSYSLVKSNFQGEIALLRQNIGYLTAMDWLKSGEIFFLYQNQLTLATFKGSFTFANIPLDPGENRFTARAVDDAGNRGDSSEELRVVYDNALLADLVVSEDDISVYPSYPKPGEEVLIAVTVSNTGHDDAKGVRLDLYAWLADGDLVLLGTETIPRVAGEGSETISLNMSAGAAGLQSIIVVVDPAGEHEELSEGNNYATKELYITEKEELLISTTLAAESYKGNKNMAIAVAVRNSGRARTGILHVVIEDLSGGAVETVGSTPVDLQYGVKGNFSFVWNTAATIAGAYRVHTIVRGVDGALVEDFDSFTILPDINLATSVATGKLTYGANESVAVSISLRNNGSNYVIPQVRVRTTVSDALNGVLFLEEKLLTGFFPGAGSETVSSWNSGIASPGIYTVTVESIVDDRVVSVASTRVTIKAMPFVTGSVEVDTPTVMAGNTFRCSYKVGNFGNTDTAGLLRISLVDPLTANAVATEELSVALAQNSRLAGTVMFASQGLELKLYRVNLDFVSQGGRIPIAHNFLTVQDGTPPVLTIVGPLAGATYNATIPLAVLAMDNTSGVERVEYQIDGGPWKLLPLADPVGGRYVAAWEPTIADNGFHNVVFKGRDLAGNVSIPVAVRIEVQMDNIPPATTIAAGTHIHQTPDRLFASGATLFTLSATDNFSGVAKIECRLAGGSWLPYAGPFTLPTAGEHQIGFRSVDNAGNLEAEKTFTVVIDNTPPMATIASSDPLSDGVINIVSLATTFTLTATDSVSGVRNIWYRIDDGGWQLFTAGFALAGLKAGPHVISFGAVDNVGNEEPAQAITVRLIVIEVKKEISLDPVVLVGPRKYEDEDEEDWKKKAKTDPLVTMLDFLGITYYAARDKADFERALRSGKFNIYLLMGDGKEEAGEEMREGIYYGDGLIIIKTRPDNNGEDTNAIHGVRFAGKSIERDLPLVLPESPLGQADTLQTVGKTAVALVTSPAAAVYGTLTDRKGQYPAIVYNEYGRGKALLFTFDLFSLPDKAKASELLANSLSLVKPKEHYLRAQESVPVRIEVANSTEPFDLELIERIPQTTTADLTAPKGSISGNVISWHQQLDASGKMKFDYYLNLPDTAGDYTVTSEAGYFNADNHRPLISQEMTLKVTASSADLLHKIVSELYAMSVPERKDRKKIAAAMAELHQVRQAASTAQAAEENIEKIVAATNELLGVSSDVHPVRIGLDELLKIWQRKWSLIARKDHREARETGDREVCQARTDP